MQKSILLHVIWVFTVCFVLSGRILQVNEKNFALDKMILAVLWENVSHQSCLKVCLVTLWLIGFLMKKYWCFLCPCHFQWSQRRWLSWMQVRLVIRRLRFDPHWVGNILSLRSIMKYFLLSFSPFSWLRKNSCQFLTKECAQYWWTAKRTKPAQ